MNSKPHSEAEYQDVIRLIETSYEERIDQHKAEFRKLFDAAEESLEMLESGDLEALEKQLRYIKLKCMALG